MSLTSHQQHQEAYETVSLADEDDRPLSEVSTADASDLLESKTPSVRTYESVPVGSLSRNEHNSWYFLGHGAVDAILTLGPVLFLGTLLHLVPTWLSQLTTMIVVPAMCLGLNNKPISPYGEKVKAITLLSPTIFPIIYAAILGKMLRRIGLFKAERGTTIGVSISCVLCAGSNHPLEQNLERLIGCQSIFSAFERQISLRRFDLLGVTILLAWLLSPLGGQASLRLLSTKPLVISYDSSIMYYPVEDYPKRTYIGSSRSAQENWPLFAPLYMTAVQTSRQSLIAPMDLFGNVKIPDITYLNNGATAAATEYDWNYISNNTMVNYTSILGVPVVGVPASGNCSFDLLSHYWTVNCYTLVSLPQPVAWRPGFTPNTTYPADNKASNTTFQILVDTEQSTPGFIRFEYLSRRNESIEKTELSSARCSTWPLVVESHVRCHDRSCSVGAIRRVNRTSVDVWGGPSPLSAFQNISKWMPGADLGFTQGIVSTSELIEHWMVNTDLGTLGNPETPFVDISRQLTLTNFTRRLQTAINTFWDTTIGSGVRLNNLQPGKDTTSWTSVNIQPIQYQGEVYSCSVGLALLTIVISLVLFVAANISMLLGLLTRTPDILGFASVSTRDNPYFKQHVTSYLSGLEIARALRDVRVRIGDVKSEDNIGHIALATMDARPKKLSWTRLYD
jgi:hypothetical protein